MDVATLGCPKQIPSMQRLRATSQQSTMLHHSLVNSDHLFMSWQAATSGIPIPQDWLQLHVHGGAEL
jgi:hypothetical protein